MGTWGSAALPTDGRARSRSTLVQMSLVDPTTHNRLLQLSASAGKALLYGLFGAAVVIIGESTGGLNHEV
jgi:hypothetical protein